MKENKLLNIALGKAKQVEIELSTGTIKIRELLVKELKQIVDLGADNDSAEAMIKMLKILNGCVLTPGIKLEELPSVDVEKMYIALNNISRGDKFHHSLHCGHCDSSFIQELSLNNVATTNEHQKVIELTNGLKLNMRSPNMTESLLAAADDNQIFNLAMRCIVSVDTGSDVMVIGEDVSHEELKEVIEYLDESGFAALVNFIETIPTVILRTPVKCPHCEATDIMELRGLKEILSLDGE